MRKKKRKFPLSSILIFLVVIASIFLVSSIKIERITCSNQYGSCSKEAETFLRSLEGQKLFFVRRSVKTFLKEGLVIVDYTASFKLPNKYVVNIIERKPKYALLFKETFQATLVDDDGYILAFVENTSLPLVKTKFKPGNTGEKVDSTSLFVLKLMADLNSFYQVKEGELTEDGFKVKLNSGENVIFPLTGDKEILLSSLAITLSKLNSMKDDPTMIINTIDLRFKNPVLR